MPEMHSPQDEVAGKFEVREVIFLPSRSWTLVAGNIIEGKVVAGMYAAVDAGTLRLDFKIDAVEYIDRIAQRESLVALVFIGDKNNAEMMDAVCPIGTVIDLLAEDSRANR